VAYTAGLLHDIGKLVIDRVMTREHRTAIEQIIQQRGLSGAEAERHVLGAGHAETGACLLRKWGLPSILIEAVENHHAPVCQPVPELSCVILLANTLSRHLQSKTEGELQLRPVELGAATALGLDAADLEKELAALQKRMEKLEKFSAA
jgi:putative nucleotidyltransferase with HDIG domain